MRNLKNYPLVTGNIVPTISYFTEQGMIQEDVNRLQALHALYHGADALFLLGSTGEGTYLKDLGEKFVVERIKLIMVSADAVADYWANSVMTNPKFVPILIGVYGETSNEVIQDIKTLISATDTYYSKHSSDYQFISKYLKSQKAATFSEAFIYGLVIPPPRKAKLDVTGLTEFYRAILESNETQINKKNAKIPVYMYNNPSTFGNNVISIEIIEALKTYANLYGIKDSSESLDQKKEYIKFLSESFTVNCGKEGSIGSFLQLIPKEKRKYAGFVPSLSNLTNNPTEIFKEGILGNDDKMLQKQKEMNDFREFLYDSEVSKGKAQRGVKCCFEYLYETLVPTIPTISTSVKPDFKREIPPAAINKMRKTVDDCVKKGFIRPISKIED